jgi:PD-(D/E)XK endonuclease
MKKRKPKISDKKLRGEWAEMRFMVRAAEHGLHVSKPWGEMQSYDFIVGSPNCFVSVQVKSTTAELDNGYVCTVRGAHKSYAAGSFDFLAAYVVFEDVWYIIPGEEIQGKGCLTLYPNSKKAKYEKYREAWDLLRRPEFNGEIKACAEEFPLECDDACQVGALLEFRRSLDSQIEIAGD